MTHASNLWKITLKHHRHYQNEGMNHKPFTKVSYGREGRTCSCSAAVSTAQAHFHVKGAKQVPMAATPKLHKQNEAVPNP